MAQPDHITRDIARKCGDDVAAAIKRSMALVDGAAEKLAVSMSAAASAMGTATGSYLAFHDLQRLEPLYPAAAAKGLWRTLEPMTVRVMTEIRERNGQAPGAQTILPNRFPLVDVIQADRDALYGGLISAGHPSEFANHMAYDMEDDDGGLQMLARHRLAFSSPSSDRDDIRDRILAVLRESEGFWRACSGCQESVDGCVSTKDYPYSPLFRCQPGGGCRECGGIGVLWDDGRGYDDVTWDEEQDAATPTSYASGGN